MNSLTAIRSFAKPGFCPVKRTRIFADRWYKVTFQNVETDPRSDYVGLADGEYTQLLPGNKAREARDARLNHCNAITEWNGPVFEVFTTTCGNMKSDPVFVSCQESADLTVELARREHAQWVSDCAKERDLYAAKLAANPSETWRAGSIEACDQIIANGMSTFAFTVKQVK